MTSCEQFKMRHLFKIWWEVSLDLIFPSKYHHPRFEHQIFTEFRPLTIYLFLAIQENTISGPYIDKELSWHQLEEIWWIQRDPFLYDNYLPS